jgi:hypothetical protein
MGHLVVFCLLFAVVRPASIVTQSRGSGTEGELVESKREGWV